MNVLNRDKILEAAKLFIEEGKYERAIKEYNKLLDADPKDTRVKLQIAELFIKLRQTQNAIKTYREVAEIHVKDGFFLKAVTVYKNILRLNPSLIDINLALAELYQKMGLTQDAIHQYEILANTYDRQGLFPEALAMRQKLVELAPNNANFRIRLAENLQRDEKIEESIDQLEILATQYREAETQPDKLIELYERILPHRPDNIPMLIDLIRLNYGKENYKRALQLLEQHAKQLHDNTELLEMQAYMYGKLNQLESARVKYQELAEHYLEGGNSNAALDAYQKILYLLPEESENLRPIVEGIQKGKMEAMLSQAAAMRAAEEAKAESGKEEAAAPQTFSPPQSTTTPSQPVKAQPSATEPVSAPRQFSDQSDQPAAPKPKPKRIHSTPISSEPDEVQSHLELYRAYQQTGLQEEADEEKQAIIEWAKKTLKTHSNDSTAKKFLKEVGVDINTLITDEQSQPQFSPEEKKSFQPKKPLTIPEDKPITSPSSKEKEDKKSTDQHSKSKAKKISFV